MANRRRIDVSRALFAGLMERGRDLDINFPSDDKKRWIEKVSHDDSQLLATADASFIRLSRRNIGMLLIFEGARYFAISGLDAPEILPSGLSEIPPTPGLFSVFVYVSSMHPTGTSAQIRDVLETYNASTPGYNGHALEDVMPLYPAVRFYSISPDFFYTNSIERIYGSYVSRSYADGPLMLSDEALEEFAQFFESASETIPFHLPLRGLLSYSWSGVYLELYRCIEQLFSVPKLTALTKAWESDKSIIELSRLLENVISWRPREEEAIEQLFGMLDTGLCANLYSCFVANADFSTLTDVRTSTARKVYKLRNVNVHFRPSLEQEELGDANWNYILICMLQVVRSLYDQVGERLHGNSKLLEIQADKPSEAAGEMKG